MEDREVLGGRYKLLTELGSGGMAVVWRAHDEVLGRPVAVKLLAGRFAGDEQSRNRIRDEARAAAALSHPNIAQVYDYGESAESGTPLPYVVMELVNGPTLQQRVASGPLPPRTVFRICGEVAAALAAAHADGLVHRDIKMANIMVTPGGAKVVDFGIAAAVGPAAPEEMLVGTPAYLAPERLTGGAVVPASDVYALGVLLYRLLAHESPWSVETTTQMLQAHVYAEPAPLPSLPGVPPAVADMIDRCLLKDPADRPTATEVSATLGDAAEAAVAPADTVRAGSGATAPRVPWPAPGRADDLGAETAWRVSGWSGAERTSGAVGSAPGAGALDRARGAAASTGGEVDLDRASGAVASVPRAGERQPTSGAAASARGWTDERASGAVASAHGAGALDRTMLDEGDSSWHAGDRAAGQGGDRATTAGGGGGTATERGDVRTRRRGADEPPVIGPRRGGARAASQLTRPGEFFPPAGADDLPTVRPASGAPRGRRGPGSGALGVQLRERKGLLAAGAAVAVAGALLAGWLIPDEDGRARPSAGAAATPSVTTRTTAPGVPAAEPARGGQPPAGADAPGRAPVTNSAPARSASAPASSTPSVAPSAAAPEPSASVTDPPPPSPSTPPAPQGRRLTSPGGAAYAICERGKATLTGWEPASGFTADPAEPGPASIARIFFVGERKKYRMTVTCVGGTPTPLVLPI